jgi:hypothetical protein
VLTTKAKGGNGWNFNWWEISNGVSAGVTQLSRNDVSNITTGVSAMNIYPNPVSGNFKLSVCNNYTGKLKVRVINANGMVVKVIDLQKTSIGTVDYTLSIPELKRGVYIMQATMNEWNSNKQIMRQ